jgi:hypothetical protein
MCNLAYKLATCLKTSYGEHNNEHSDSTMYGKFVAEFNDCQLLEVCFMEVAFNVLKTLTWHVLSAVF